MNKQTVILGLAALAFVGVSIVWLAGGFNNKVPPGMRAVDADVVADFTVDESSYVPSVTVPAQIMAENITQISAQTMAEVKAIAVKAGSTVKAGELLVQLDDAAAKTALAQAKAQSEGAKAHMMRAEQALKRAESLWQNQLIAKDAYEQAITTMSAAEAALRAANEQVASTEVTLAYTRITAPIDGVVVDKLVNQGDRAMPGQPLLNLYSATSLQVQVPLAESQAVALNLKDILAVTVPSLKKTMTGQVNEIVPMADGGSRTFLIKLTIAAQSSQLRPGMYAQVALPQKPQSRILIPKAYVQSHGQLTMVTAVIEGEPQKRYVRLGPVVAEQVTVISGLTAGEQLLLPE